MDTEKKEIPVAIRIGRYGTKLHPGYATELENGRLGGAIIICGCKGTNCPAYMAVAARSWDKVTCTRHPRFAKQST